MNTEERHLLVLIARAQAKLIEEKLSGWKFAMGRMSNQIDPEWESLSKDLRRYSELSRED